jgi:hypothetical protein
VRVTLVPCDAGDEATDEAAGDGGGGAPRSRRRCGLAAVEVAEQALELRVSGWGAGVLGFGGGGHRRRRRRGCRKRGRSLAATTDLGELNSEKKEVWWAAAHSLWRACVRCAAERGIAALSGVKETPK